MDQGNSNRELDETRQESPAQAEADRLAVAARYVAELALLEARVQIARSCGA